MPPKRAAATPATPLFQDCVFAVSGVFPSHNQAQIFALCTSPEAGATTAASLTKKVTHLITNDAEVAKGSTKVQKAITAGTVSLVQLEWIIDSLQKKKRLAETAYSVSATGSSASAAAAPAVAPTTNGKRKASDEVDDKVQKKMKDLSDKVSKKAANAGPVLKRPPVDRSCTLAAGYEVYMDDEVAWNARLNQTNIGQNNNKFYLIQLLHNSKSGQYAVFCHWGRVGASGQSSTDMAHSLEVGQRIFEKKYKDKTKNNWADRENFVKHSGKYFLLPPDDGDSDDEDEDTKAATKKPKEEEVEHPVPESKLHPKVQDLMGFIFNTSMMNRQMKELDYDADKMPLGKLAKSTILHGYSVLKKIGEVLDSKRANTRNELLELSSDFYTVIPHNFGMRTPPIIDNAPMLKKKLEMLESLGEIEIAQKLIKENKTMNEALTCNPLDQQFSSLKLNKLEPMDKETDMFKIIEKFTKNSHGATHGAYDLVIDEVFDLDRQGEAERFDDAGFSKFHNRRLLWHGSRLTNYVGILSQGLRIAPPEAPVTGYMFDKGAYFADCVSKSANYCFTNRTDNIGLMLLCEVALGDMHELEQSDYHAKTNSEKAGKHSTKGCGRSYPDESQDVIIENDLRVQVGTLKTAPPKNNGYYGLQYNEYIVYNTSQIKMRYLLKMKFDYDKKRR